MIKSQLLTIVFLLTHNVFVAWLEFEAQFAAVAPSLKSFILTDFSETWISIS